MATINTTAKAFSKALKGSIRSAVPVTLTKMAYQGKQLAPDQISKDMTLRSRSFISRSLRYEKSTRGRLVSQYGMIERERFTGLAEQEFGRTKTDRAPTIQSRRGALQKRVSPKLRLKRSNQVIFRKNFKSKPKRNAEMLAVLRRKKYKGLFFIQKETNIRQGIYKFVSGRAARLQLIHAIGDIPRQKKRPWMQHTNDQILKKDIGAKTWKSTMSRYMSDRARRKK